MHNFLMGPERQVLEILFDGGPSGTDGREFFINFISKFHKVAVQDIIKGGSFGRVFDQNFTDQVDGFFWGIAIFRN